jgi:hypothetical protein
VLVGRVMPGASDAVHPRAGRRRVDPADGRGSVWEERRRSSSVAWTSCEACIEDQPNQQAHMEFGGCLEEHWYE